MKTARYCADCKYRGECSTECPELSLYLKEVEAEPVEINCGVPGFGGKIEWSSGYDMTKREKEILMLRAKGLTNKEVAEVLNTTANNIRVMLFKLKQKHLS